MIQKNSTPWAAVRRACLTLLVAGAVAGCDDENLFRTDTPPSLDEITSASPSVVEGDTLSFNVEASGPRRITAVRLVLTGALERDFTLQVEEPSSQLSETVRIAIPHGTGPGSELNISASVIDVVPDTSEARSVTIQVIDATRPLVTGSVSPAEVGAGDTITIAVQAEDNRGLAFLGAHVTDGAGYDTTVVRAVEPVALDTSLVLTLRAPELDLGELTFTPFAVDVNDIEGRATTAPVTFTDRKGPTFLSLETNPDSTIPLGDSVQVEVRVHDPTGIRRVTFIGLARRGSPSMGTDTIVERFAAKTIDFPRPTEGDTLPKTYTLNPYLTSDDSDITETVEIRVIAEDAVGNVSDTTKTMFVGGPNVKITYPPADFGVRLGARFDVRIAIQDEVGLDSVRLILSNGTNQRIRVPLPARTDTPLVLVQQVTMPPRAGTVNIRAVAWNKTRISGQSRIVSVAVHPDSVSDDEPPVVSVETERLVPPGAETRMELSDQIRVVVSAFDANTGLSRIGLTAVVARGGTEDTVVVAEQRTFDGSRSLESLTFQVSLDSLYDRLGVSMNPAVRDSILPENLDFLIHGFAADLEGNVACSVGAEEQRQCTPEGYSGNRFYEAADTTGLPLAVEVVRGNTVLLDNTAAVIADLAVDTVDDRLFLSNISENLVEVLQLNSDFTENRFGSPVQVGSRPLGLFIGDRIVSDDEQSFGIGVTPGDRVRTLLVANSGGTNLSLVHLDPNLSRVQEVDVVRLRTPNSVLMEIEESEDESGFLRYLVTYYDLSDRPQFLAQDSLLRTVYSTALPPGLEGPTTVRFVHVDPDPSSTADEPEVRFLLNTDMVDESSDATLVLANVDSLGVAISQAGNDGIVVFTHEPGYPERVIFNSEPTPQIADAVADVARQIQAVMDARGAGAQAPMFFPFYRRGAWDFDELSWSDTTFVSASGNRGKIVIGEGGGEPTGRLMMWDGLELPRFSDEIQMRDWVHNAPDEVLGVGLNEDGSLGVSRGRRATYFFTPDLREQGEYQQQHVGGAGATFHPEHDDLSHGGHTDPTGFGAAFTGTSEHSIDVVNTFHFNLIKNLEIRHNIVGVLRSGPPLATDNNGQGGRCVELAPTEAQRKDCIVLKLYGISSAGGVVVVNVRRRDLEPYATP